MRSDGVGGSYRKVMGMVVMLVFIVVVWTVVKVVVIRVIAVLCSGDYGGVSDGDLVAVLLMGMLLDMIVVLLPFVLQDVRVVVILSNTEHHGKKSE